MKAFKYGLTFTFLMLFAAFGAQTVSIYKSLVNRVHINNPFEKVSIDLNAFKIEAPVVIVSAPETKKKAVLVKKPVAKRRLAKRLPQIKNNKRFVVPNETVALTTTQTSEIQFYELKNSSNGEINNSQLIHHYGVTASMPEVISMSQIFESFTKTNGRTLVAELERLEQESRKRLVASATEKTLPSSDSVKVEQSANEKKFREIKINSDLEVSTQPEQKIEYSDEELAKSQMETWKSFGKEDRGATDEQISKSVLSAIHRAQKDSTSVASAATTKRKLDSSTARNNLSNTQKRRPNMKQLVDAAKSMNSVLVNTQPVLTTQKSKVTLRGVEANFGIGFTDDVRNFEFAPVYDRNESYNSMGGEIVIEEVLSGHSGVIRGNLNKSGYVPMVMDLAIDQRDTNKELAIPFVDMTSYNEFLDKNKLKGLGGHLLVELSNSVIDVDLEVAAEAKLYFDDNFKLVDFNSDYRFVLFVGVRPGNIVMSYLLDDDSRAEKVANIPYGTIYYDLNEIQSSKARRLSLLEKGPFGSTAKPLAINENELVFFNTNRRGKELVPGIYSINTPSIPKGFRNYFELQHIKESIFVGTSDKDKIEVPSPDMIAEILGLYRLNSLERVCMVQLNLTKKPLNVKFAGETDRGGMNIDELFIENNGSVASEASELTQKVIFLGEGQGVINVKVEYLDDTVDYLQTICSENVYLVEQL